MSISVALVTTIAQEVIKLGQHALDAAHAKNVEGAMELLHEARVRVAQAEMSWEEAAVPGDDVIDPPTAQPTLELVTDQETVDEHTDMDSGVSKR